MAPHFHFPQSLESLEREPADEDTAIYARFPTDVASLSRPHLEEFVKGVAFDLSDKELFCIEEQEVFDRVYSLVRGFSLLTPPCKLSLLESLRSNFSVLLPNYESLSRAAQQDSNDDEDSENSFPVFDRLSSYRNAFKIYSYFLVTILLSEESNLRATENVKATASRRNKHPIPTWNWEAQRARVLNIIANSLEGNLASLFGSADPDENYLSFISKSTFLMFENSLLIKDAESKESLCRMVAAFSTKYHFMAQSCASIMHLIHKYDSVIIPMADAVAVAERKYGDGILASTIIREVGRTNPKAYIKDTAGAENVGRFLIEIADRLPKLFSTNVGVLVPHFGGESYKIRNALVGVLGKLVAKAFKDEDGELHSKSVRLRTKQAMLEILLERCRDVSAYTRSRVLQVWAELCEEHSISIGLWNEVATIAAGRLEDKSALVRKAALSLLIMMLQHNPFGPQLRIASFEATLLQYKKKLNELEPEKSAESVLDGFQSDNDSSNESEHDKGKSDEVVNNPQDSVSDSFLETIDRSPPKETSLPDVGNIEQTKALVASLEAGLNFSKCMTTSMPILVQLLASSSSTDVENTILLLMRCKQFQIDGAESCLRKMLSLVFSQDKSIYEAVENAFITIYMSKNSIETARNLLNLAIDSDIGDLAALELIVGALVSKGDVTSSTISALWDIFCFNINGTTAEQSRGALSILCMAASSSPGVLGTHLHYIIDIGFGRWAKVDPLLARTACIALQRLSPEESKRLLGTMGNRVFDILENLVSGLWLPDDVWYAAVDKAIPAIYAIHPTPETLATIIVKKTLNNVYSSCQSNQEGDDEISDPCSVDLMSVSVPKLNRFLYVASHMAMNHLVYIDSCVKRIMKQKLKGYRMGDTNQDDQQTDAAEVDNINKELGVSASEDTILDSLSEKAEKEIISGGIHEKNLIGQSAPFLSTLCRNITLMQKYPELQASGMLALCRFMIIDSNFCEANLQLLFTVIETSQSDIVRSNCTIVLGDLAVRFPNLLEPWTEKMYARLRDPSVPVRKNAVLVLSHLILNDMMKVKGYIYEMAVRIEDENERIASLAKLFFHELSKKGSNPIYNLLPDILGQLSNLELKRESFCNIMQFLLASIKKDKQMETLVEKLCNRFNGVTDVHQWEHISYCLSQLTFTEKGIKKLMDLFTTYENALSEDSVLDNFMSIFAKAKKFAKPELKESVEAMEEKLKKSHLEMKEMELTSKNAQIHCKKINNIDCVVFSSTESESNVESFPTDGEVVDPSISSTLEQTEEVSVSQSDDTEGCSCSANDSNYVGAESSDYRSPSISTAVRGILPEDSDVSS